MKVHSGGTEAEYTYNADGLRQSKTVNGVTTKQIWDGSNIVGETDGSGAVLSVYTRGLKGVISDRAGAEETYYIYDGHGDVNMLMDSTGEIIKQYSYDAFGVEQNKDDNDTNPFRYCGEYFDNETESIYLRARYYNPDSGRFITEDPIRDGLNWYVYCGANPINLCDPWGLEQIVVSGGKYSYDEENDYKYNFIEPAIKKLIELKNNNINNENITWIIADIGWTEDDKINFTNVANDIGVGIQFISNKDELIGYINYKYAGTNDIRVNDLITKFVVFAHGSPGKIMLGFDYENYNDQFTLTMDDLTTNKIKTYDAFYNTNSMFYSCNTGTDISGEWGSNFAQKWVNLTGGKTWAYVGRTSYTYMNEGESVLNKILRQAYGFSTNGSKNYPCADNNAWVNVYWR